MGLPFSCPVDAYNDDIENVIEHTVIVKSISFGDVTTKTPVRSVSFMDRDSKPTIIGSGKMIEGCVSIRSGDTEIMNAVNYAPLSEKETTLELPLLESSNPKHEAATKLQKVYKSFRTRRKLADCAVLIEQSWWKLLDFAELKRSSVSFFDLEKHETAISRWSRARTRAAKVGKGLSQNAKAQKLALQHWLEAIDPRHRYGHNLHFYYVNWLNSQSKEPFFYWLDIGEGKEVNLFEKCCRSKLQQQCIKYLGPMERNVYEVVIEEGKLLYKQTRELLDSSSGTKGTKWIFVLSTSRTLYVGQKTKGKFQHSSFLAGGATLAAGRLVVENGILKAVWPHSGHYKPTPENFQDFLSFLKENCVDITDVKMDSMDEEEIVGKKWVSHIRSNSSDEDINEKACLKTDDLLLRYKKCEQNVKADKQNLCVEEEGERMKESIPNKLILERISSHKGMKSYQLGKQLSCKWSTGAGPRIGCLRDYPSGLQSHALEQENLSPRSAPSARSSSSLSRILTSTSFGGD